MKQMIDVIHVGFPKTGTTWLQQNLLARNSGFACVGKPYLVSNDFRGLLNKFVSEDDFRFSAEHYRKVFEESLSENGKTYTEDQVKIISFELFSGGLYTGQGAKELLNRLFDTFGKTKILITIREQRAIIESHYRHYVRAGGGLHIREFLYKRNSPAVDTFGNQLLFDKFKYNRYINHCYELFGKDRVKVVPYELLRLRPNEFIAEILSFCDITNSDDALMDLKEKNPSFSYLGLQILRLVNQVLSTPQSDSPLFRPAYYMYRAIRSRVFEPVDQKVFGHVLNKKKFVNTNKYFPFEQWAKYLNPKFQEPDDRRTISEDIGDRFKESNQETAMMTNLPLGDLGYSL